MGRGAAAAAPYHRCPQAHIAEGKASHLLGRGGEDSLALHHLWQTGIGLHQIERLGTDLSHSTEDLRRPLQARAAAIKQISADLHAVAAEKRVITEKLKDIYATWRERMYSVILSDIAAACNDRVLLTELTVGAEKPPATGMPRLRDKNKTAPEPPKEEKTVIKLIGFAIANLDLTRFVSDLSKSEALSEVNLKFWRQDSMGALKLIKFEIECYPQSQQSAEK